MRGFQEYKTCLSIGIITYLPVCFNSGRKMASQVFVFGVLVAVYVAGVAAHVSFDEMINMVNNANLGWKAGRNFHLDTTIEDLQGLCGTHATNLSHLPARPYYGNDIPDEFDARKQWPGCPTISHVLNQGCCGSCWAFGTVSAFSDRLCIATEASFTLPLSEDDLNSCESVNNGCGSGKTLYAWEYLADVGVVTGGDYKSNVGCRTYEIPPQDVARDYCPGTLPTPVCQETCNNPNYEIPYDEDKHLADKHTIRTYASVESIQEDLMTHGPITATMAVYEDFYHYKEGVYQKHPYAQYSDSHAVRVLGWGTENGTPYWLIANSWGSDWGDEGLFKIRRGNDECGIENGMIAGLPLLR